MDLATANSIFAGAAVGGIVGVTPGLVADGFFDEYVYSKTGIACAPMAATIFLCAAIGSYVGSEPEIYQHLTQHKPQSCQVTSQPEKLAIVQPPCR